MHRHPGLIIQKDQVLSWSQGGSGSKTDVGMGVAGVVLFGLPGLIGFAAKKHDYTFSINYVDAAGNIQATAVGFKNNVPANQFMMEIMGMTGLSVGEVNKDLQGRIDQIKAESAEKARIASLDCARALKTYRFQQRRRGLGLLIDSFGLPITLNILIAPIAAMQRA